jgi:hypothetical protein
VSALGRYIKENVFCRCGQAVSRLAASNLIPRPEMPTSEAEVHEWWLVSPDLAAKLRAERLPVLQFGELHMWGREATGVGLEDDEALIAAIGPLAAARAPRRKPGKRATDRKRR